MALVTDPLLLRELQRQGINPADVDFDQDYAPRSLGKRHSPYAKFYRGVSGNAIGKQFMVVSGLPKVDANGDKIEVGWRAAGINFIGKNNLFRSRVQGQNVELTVRNNQPDGRKANDVLSYSPHLFLGGIEQVPGQPTLLPVDPVNSNYIENTLEWDYGICKRRLRIIQGAIFGSWIFSANPGGEVRIKYNQVGNFRLKLGQYATDDDTEVLPATTFEIDEFGQPRQYPFTVSDSQTFNPDANPETTSVDGIVGHDLPVGSGVSWAALVAAAGNYATPSAASTYIYIRADDSGGNWNQLWRGILLFDTSALPDDATISSAILSVYGVEKENLAGWLTTYNVYTSTPASNTDLVGTDYAQIGSVAKSTAITYANFLVGSYNDFALNDLTIISRTGITKLGIREAAHDVAVVAPAPWGISRRAFVRYYDAEFGTNIPRLVITYTAAPSGVTIQSGPTTYLLLAELVLIGYERSPIQVPLPGANPNLYDLGQFRPFINIEGKIPVVAGSDEGITISSKNNLEDAIRSWYNTTITVTILGASYTAKVASCSFTMLASRESIWDYQLKLLTLGRT